MAILAKLFIAFLVVVEPLANAVQHTVNWNTGTDYDTWASDKTFTVGDTILFTYSGSHSIDEVSSSDYTNCNTGNALLSDTSGRTTIPLSSPGTRYFVCGSFGHCGGGMKLAIPVVAASGGSSDGSNPPTTPSGGGDSPSATTTPPSGTHSPTHPSGATGGFGNVNGIVIGFSVVVVAAVAFVV